MGNNAAHGPLARYIFVTDELPKPGAAGHLALNHAIICWLQNLGHHVTILLVGTRLSTPIEHYPHAAVAGPHIASFRKHLIARTPAGILARAFVRQLPTPLATKLRSARHGADVVLGSFTVPADTRWCASYIARSQPDAVIIDTIFRAGILDEPELATVNTIIIAHDVFHRRHLALTSAGYRVQPQRLTCEDEAAWLCGARHIAAIQPDEARILAAMCPLQKIFTTAMPATPCPPPPGSIPIPGRLVFVGSATLPNLDGLRWFLNEIWPLLKNRGITLDLIGDCGAALPALPNGVTVHGRVTNLAPLLHCAALAIAPLRVGSGLKIKLLEYARHGLHTIATPASLEGFAAEQGAPFTAAAMPEAFARAILTQLATPCPPTIALAYVIRHYAVAASFAGLANALGFNAST